MKIEITTNVKTTKTVDVRLPYYYKHDLGSDHGESIIYGKIEELEATAIHESNWYGGKVSFEIEHTPYKSIKNSGFGCYFSDEFKSSEKEFNAAKERLLAFI